MRLGQETMELLARFGYAARGVVYLLVGALAAMAAGGWYRASPDTKGALRTILVQPYGDILLGIVAVGLVAFAFWRALQALADPDCYGRDTKAWVIRGALFVSGLIHLALSFSALSLILGESQGGGDEGARDWTARLLAQPFGPWLVGAVGSVIIATGVAIAIKGWRAGFLRRLAVSSQSRSWVVPVGRFGLIARGVVFMMIGGFLIIAALHADPTEARGLGGALTTLQQQPYGWALLGVVALGLAAFGVYGLVEAAFRRMGALPGSSK